MTTKTQRHELEAWLGDGHGLSDEQVTELVRLSDDIADRYPGPDDADDRAAALTAAYRLMIEDPTAVVDDLAAQIVRWRREERSALVALRQVALMVIGNHRGLEIDTQAGFARRAGVDRMAVRDWLGLRG